MNNTHIADMRKYQHHLSSSDLITIKKLSKFYCKGINKVSVQTPLRDVEQSLLGIKPDNLKIFSPLYFLEHPVSIKIGGAIDLYIENLNKYNFISQGPKLKKEIFYQFLFVQQIFSESSITSSKGGLKKRLSKKETNGLPFRAGQNKPLTSIKGNIENIESKSQSNNSNLKNVIEFITRITNDKNAYKNQKISSILENIRLVPETSYPHGVSTLGDVAPLYSPTAASQVGASGVKGFKAQNYLNKNKIKVFEDKVFITYKKSFLCYWLLPFLGLIGGANSTLFKSSTLFPMNGPTEVTCSLREQVKTEFGLIHNNVKIEQSPFWFSSTHTGLGSTYGEIQNLPLSKITIGVGETNLSNNKKLTIFNDKDNKNKSVLIKILNIYRTQMAKISSPNQKYGDLIKLSEFKNLDVTLPFTSPTKGLGVDLPHRGKTKSQKGSLKSTDNLSPYEGLESYNLGSFTDFSLAIFNRNIKVRSNFKWYWFDLCLNNKTITKTSNQFPDRLSLLNYNVFNTKVNKMLSFLDFPLKDGVPFKTSKKSILTSFLQKQVSSSALLSNNGKNNNIYIINENLKPINKQLNPLDSHFYGLKNFSNLIKINNNLQLEQTDYLIGIVKKIQMSSSNLNNLKNKEKKYRKATNLRGNPYKSKKKADYLITVSRSLPPVPQPKGGVGGLGTTNKMYSGLPLNLDKGKSKSKKELNQNIEIGSTFYSYWKNQLNISYNPNKYLFKDSLLGDLFFAELEKPFKSIEIKKILFLILKNKTDTASSIEVQSLFRDCPGGTSTSGEKKDVNIYSNLSNISKRDISDNLYHCILKGLKISLDNIAEVACEAPVGQVTCSRREQVKGVTGIISLGKSKAANPDSKSKGVSPNHLWNPNTKVNNNFMQKTLNNDSINVKKVLISSLTSLQNEPKLDNGFFKQDLPTVNAANLLIKWGSRVDTNKMFNEVKLLQSNNFIKKIQNKNSYNQIKKILDYNTKSSNKSLRVLMLERNLLNINLREDNKNNISNSSINLLFDNKIKSNLINSLERGLNLNIRGGNLNSVTRNKYLITKKQVFTPLVGELNSQVFSFTKETKIPSEINNNFDKASSLGFQKNLLEHSTSIKKSSLKIVNPLVGPPVGGFDFQSINNLTQNNSFKNTLKEQKRFSNHLQDFCLPIRETRLLGLEETKLKNDSFLILSKYIKLITNNIKSNFSPYKLRLTYLPQLSLFSKPYPYRFHNFTEGKVKGLTTLDFSKRKLSSPLHSLTSEFIGSLKTNTKSVSLNPGRVYRGLENIKLNYHQNNLDLNYKSSSPFEKQFLSYLSLSKSRLLGLEVTCSRREQVKETKLKKLIDINSQLKMKPLRDRFLSFPKASLGANSNKINLHKKNTREINYNYNSWFKQIYLKSKIKLILCPQKPKYIKSNSLIYTNILNSIKEVDLPHRGKTKESKNYFVKKSTDKIGSEVTCSLREQANKIKFNSPLILLKNRLFINKEINNTSSIPLVGGYKTDLSNLSLVTSPSNNEVPLSRSLPPVPQPKGGVVGLGTTNCPLGQTKDQETRIRKKYQLKIKRRLKKMKKETRRRKKRKIFYPRPSWIVFSMYKKFVDYRGWKKRRSLPPVPQPKGGVEGLRTTKNQGFSRLSTGKTNFSNKVPCILRTGGLRGVSSSLWLSNTNSNYPIFNRILGNFLVNTSEVEQGIKLESNRSLFKNTKDFYHISRTVMGDLKRILMKSNWLKSYLNPYLDKVKNIYKEMQTISQKEQIYNTLQSFFIDIYGSNNQLPSMGLSKKLLLSGISCFDLPEVRYSVPLRGRGLQPLKEQPPGQGPRRGTGGQSSTPIDDQSGLSFTGGWKKRRSKKTINSTIYSPMHLNMKNSIYEIENYLPFQNNLKNKLTFNNTSNLESNSYLKQNRLINVSEITCSNLLSARLPVIKDNRLKVGNSLFSLRLLGLIETKLKTNNLPRREQVNKKINNLKRQNSINLLEYNRIIYQRIQRIILNIRDNLTLNGQIKNRSKKLGKNIRTFIKREYTKRDPNTGINTNQNASFWSKILKSNILKFTRSFVINGYEEISPYNTIAQILARNNFYWALNKSAVVPNNKLDASSVKKLWETYKIREVSKSNKTKKIIFNMLMKYNNIDKSTNSLDGYNHVLEKNSNYNNLSSVQTNYINKLKKSSLVWDSILFYPEAPLCEAAVGEYKGVQTSLNVNLDEFLKSSFKLPFKTYTLKSEQKLINIERKLKSLGLLSKKKQNNLFDYKNAYFRFLKQELLKEKNLYTPGLSRLNCSPQRGEQLTSGPPVGGQRTTNYLLTDNPPTDGLVQVTGADDLFFNIKQKSLNNLFNTSYSKNSLTSGYSYKIENRSKMANNNNYWWSFLKIDNAYYNFLSPGNNKVARESTIELQKDNTFKIKTTSSSSDIESSNVILTLSSFLFHFCALISFISLGGVRTLIKFYYILFSKITKILSKVHKVRLLPKSYKESLGGDFITPVESKGLDVHRTATINPVGGKGLNPPLTSFQRKLVTPKPIRAISLSIREPKKSLKEYKKYFLNYLTAQSRKTNILNFNYRPEIKPESVFNTNELKDVNINIKLNPWLISDFEKLIISESFLNNTRFLFSNINKKLIYTKLGPNLITHTPSTGGLEVKGAERDLKATVLNSKEFSYVRKLNKNNKFLLSNISKLQRPNFVEKNLKGSSSFEKTKDIEKFIKTAFLFDNIKQLVPHSSLPYRGPAGKEGLKAIIKDNKPTIFLNSSAGITLNKNKIKMLYNSFLKLSMYGKVAYKISFYTYLLIIKSLDILSTPASFIYKFFEKPGEYVVENLAYSFLVEWSADLISTIPDTVDTSQALYFAKVNRNTSPLIFMQIGLDSIYPSLYPIKAQIGLTNKLIESLYQTFLLAIINSALKRFFNSSFLLFIQQLCEPDLDYINRKKKGIIFWDIWGEYLKTVAEENSINIYELTTDKEEQIRLLTKYEEIVLKNKIKTQPVQNTSKVNKTQLFSNFLVPLRGQQSLSKIIRRGKSKRIVLDFSFWVSQPAQGPRRGTEVNLLLCNKFIKGNQPPKEIGPLWGLGKLKNNYQIKATAGSTGYPTYGGVSTTEYTAFLSTYMSNKNKTYNAWSVSQFLSYQGKDSDLFIDLHPPKTFSSSAASLKYSFSVQQPIGSIVCQIFSGIFYKQISKNILVVGSSALEKSLLIQAIAGETELKIITDNAHRYAMVYRGVAVGIKLLRDVFEALSVHTPCIFLMEDIHAIGERRPFLIDESSPNAAESTYNKNQSMQGLFLKEKSSNSRELETKNNKHLLSHYKKPYKEPRGLATNHFSFTFLFADPFTKFRNSEIRTSSSALSLQVIKRENDAKHKNLVQSSKPKLKQQSNNSKQNKFLQNIYASSLLIKPSKDDLLSPPASSPFSVLILKEATKMKHKKTVKEMPWFGLPGEQFSLISKYNYSIRIKVALLADLVLSNLSVKLDMITDLLVIIDSVKGNRGFVVFATTHLPYILDPALRRPGRFDETISLPLIPSLYSRWANYRYNVHYLTTTVFKKYTIPFNTISNKGTTLNLTKYNLMSSYLDHYESRFVIDELINYIYTQSSTLNQRNIKLFNSNSIFNNLCVKNLNKSSLYHINKYLTDVDIDKNKKTKISITNKGLLPLYLSAMNSSSLKNNLSVNVISNYYTSIGKSKGTLPIWRALNNPPEVTCLDSHPSLRIRGWESTSQREQVNGGVQKKLNNKQILKLKSKNYSYACRSLISLILYTHKSEVDVKQIIPIAPLGEISKKHMLKWPSMFQNSNTLVEEYSSYLSLFSYPFMLKFILMSLIGGKLGENFAISSNLNLKNNHPNKKIDIAHNQIDPLKFENCFVNQNNQFLFNFDKTWKYASSLLFSYIQKRQCSALNKNLAFCSTKLLSFNNKFSLMEAPSPPISVILLPAKRYENYKRTFNNQYRTLTSQHNFDTSVSEKINLHQQQRMLKRLYKYPIKEFFRSHILKINSTNQDLAYPDQGKGQATSSNYTQNLSSFNNSQLVLSPLEKTQLASVNKPSSINSCYRNIIYNRHKTYLTNQWWNAQQGEHNSETTFLSDIDWRYTFVPSIGDIQVDFPDAEQFYNPRNRRWILTNGDWNYWFNLQTELKEIYSHYIYECFSKVYHSLDKNREIIDFYAEIISQTPLVSNLKERDLLNLYKRFYTN